MYDFTKLTISDATELEIGELSRAELDFAEPSWQTFGSELSRAGYFQKRAEYELTFFGPILSRVVETTKKWGQDRFFCIINSTH